MWTQHTDLIKAKRLIGRVPVSAYRDPTFELTFLLDPG